MALTFNLFRVIPNFANNEFGTFQKEALVWGNASFFSFLIRSGECITIYSKLWGCSCHRHILHLYLRWRHPQSSQLQLTKLLLLQDLSVRDSFVSQRAQTETACARYLSGVNYFSIWEKLFRHLQEHCWSVLSMLKILSKLIPFNLQQALKVQ